MQIFWHGFTCIRIEASHGDRQATLVTDPYESNQGLRFPRTLAPDVVALSNQDIKRFNLEGFTNKPFLINSPGEYEVQGIFAYAIPFGDAETKGARGIMYRFEIEGVSIGFLGGLHRVLTEAEVEALGNIDVLLLPVGGKNWANAKQAVETISLVEPRMVIPLAHHVPGLKEQLGTADAFCKELVCTRQDANKIKITKRDLPAEDLVVTVLERA